MRSIEMSSPKYEGKKKKPHTYSHSCEQTTLKLTFLRQEGFQCRDTVSPVDGKGRCGGMGQVLFRQPQCPSLCRLGQKVVNSLHFTGSEGL